MIKESSKKTRAEVDFEINKINKDKIFFILYKKIRIDYF